MTWPALPRGGLRNGAKCQKLSEKDLTAEA
jgi:hypothetical protein